MEVAVDEEEEEEQGEKEEEAAVWCKDGRAAMARRRQARRIGVGDAGGDGDEDGGVEAEVLLG